jgi:hypothetical protein
MNPQASTVRNTRHDPQTDEIVMQERSCDPAPDPSLPAEDVLINRMRDMDQSAQATLFVP